jgi:hypothetical protein
VKRFMGCMKISIYGLQKLNVIMDHYGWKSKFFSKVTFRILN